ALFLLEHGMSKELFEMLDARSRAIEDMATNQDKMDERLRKNFDLNERLKEAKTRQDIPRIIQEWRRAWEQKAASGMTALEQDAYDTFNREHPHATADEKADFIRDLRTRTRNADQEFADRWWDEHPNGTSEQFSEAFGRYKKGQKFPPGGAAGNT